MTPRLKWALIVGGLAVVSGAVVLAFPRALGFVEMAARDIRYFWWLILIVAVGGWLVWSSRGPKA